MRHKPKLTYCGLTIVLSHPSRFDSDRKKLLSGYAGLYLDQDCLQPLRVNRYMCDVRTADTIHEGLLDNTKVILLLGDQAFKSWTTGYEKYSLNEQRGYCLHSSMFPQQHIIATYFPQDCMDPDDYEKKLNPLCKRHEDNPFNEKFTSDVSEKRRHGSTQRRNYRFWLQEDIKKALTLLRITTDEIHKEPSTRNTRYDIYPVAANAIQELVSNKGQRLFLDIETDSDYNVLCFSYGFSIDRVCCVPLLRCDYSTAYPKGVDQYKILQALAVAMRDNTTVCHNTMFDLLVLALKYRLPFGRNIYDTMLAHHRCWPEVEKSLGHAISHLTLFEEYHKDEGIFEPRNTSQEHALWKYNAKDVSSMILVHNRIEYHASNIPGLRASIFQANEMIYPYLVSTIHGMYFDEVERQQMLTENDRLMTQYLRCIRILTGGVDVLPTSNKQCNEYFHNMLGYKVVGRSKLGNASWNEDSLRKLKLKKEGEANPVIDFMLAYRMRAKESGSLKFEEWERKI